MRYNLNKCRESSKVSIVIYMFYIKYTPGIPTLRSLHSKEVKSSNKEVEQTEKIKEKNTHSWLKKIHGLIK